MVIKLQGTNSAAAPGLTNDGADGVVVGTDSVDISIAGTSKVKVDSSGKVGIGTTSPSQELTVYGSDPVLSVQEASVSSQVDIGTGTSTGYINIQKADGTRTVQINGNDESYFNGGNLKIGDGDLVIGTSGHGIDFSATSDATGKTSELLDDYEKGTWSPNFRTYSGSSWADVSFTTNPTTNIATYTKVGNIVRVSLWMYGFQTSTSGSAYAAIGNLPYSCVNQQGAGTVGYTNNTFSNENQNRCLVSTTELEMYIENNWATWADGSSASLYITAVYQTA